MQANRKLIVVKIATHLHVFFYKKPLYKQPSTRQPKFKKLLKLQGKRNFWQIAHWNRCLVQRKAVPEQFVNDIALEFSS